MTRHIRDRAPDGADYFVINGQAVIYYMIGSYGHVYYWSNEAGWVYVPQVTASTLERLPNAHKMRLGPRLVEALILAMALIAVVIVWAF